MKRLFVLFVILLPLVGWGQMCNVAVSQLDYGCQNDRACPPQSYTNCTSISFTAPCTDNFGFDVWTVCPTGTDCANCAGCAVLFREGQMLPVGSCTSAGTCSNDRECTNSCTIQLVQGAKYTLYVCLSSCNMHDCDPDECRDDCYAKTCIRYPANGTPCFQ